MASIIKSLIGLSAVVYMAVLRFARNRPGYFFAVIKSPKLLFIYPWKEHSFHFVKMLISSDSELYQVGKIFIEKLLQNVIFNQSNFGYFQIFANNS